MGAGAVGAAANLSAGVSILGKDSTKDLLAKAAELELDVLAVFEVQVKENVKTNLVNNDTRIVIYDVASGEPLKRSKPLNNIAVQKYRAEEEKDDEDPVTLAFDELFTVLDSDPERALKMCDMPAGIRPEHVESRVAAILASATSERLSALAEIKFFHHRGLISDGLLEKSFQKVLGEPAGTKLASGKEEARLDVVNTLISPP